MRNASMSRQSIVGGRTCTRMHALCAIALSGVLALTGCAAPAASEDGSTAVDTRTLLDAREPAFEPPAPEPEPTPEPEPQPYQPRVEDLATLSGQKEPFAFTVDEGQQALELPEGIVSELNAASKELSGQKADVGYLLFDLETGRGVAANIDARVFVASSIKAPYALFLCETQLDIDEMKLDDKVDGDATLASLVEAAVSESDNDAYHTLRNQFAGLDFRSWLDGLGIGGEFSADLGTPYYTARESAILWMHMHEYLNSDAPSASWLNELLENTTVSFMRHAIANDSVHVISKAGWLDGKEDYDGFCDSGIVTEDGHPYLLTVMSNLPYSAEAEYPFETLVSTLWGARGELGTS